MGSLRKVGREGLGVKRRRMSEESTESMERKWEDGPGYDACPWRFIMKGRVGLIDMSEQPFAWTNVMAATKKQNGRLLLIVGPLPWGHGGTRGHGCLWPSCWRAAREKEPVSASPLPTQPSVKHRPIIASQTDVQYQPSLGQHGRQTPLPRVSPFHATPLASSHV